MKFSPLVIVIILSACKGSVNEPIFERYNVLPDSGQGKLYCKWEIKQPERLNLTPMIDGVDSFELRLWIHGPSWEGHDLFIVKYDTSWKAFHYFLERIISLPSKVVQVFSDSTFFVKSINPVKGWKVLFDSMSQFRLDTLPTQRLIPGFGYAQILDGHSFEVEVATKKYYRRLQYSHPGSYPQQQSQIFAAFIEMFKRHLGNDPEWMGHY